MRIEIFALACGIRTFDEPAMLVMSSPIALIDGCAHSRDADGARPGQVDPVEHVGAGAEVVGAEVLARPRCST